MDDGHVVVDSIVAIEIGDITYDLARESGFASVDDLLQIARHGRGDNVYDRFDFTTCRQARGTRRELEAHLRRET